MARPTSRAQRAIADVASISPTKTSKNAATPFSLTGSNLEDTDKIKFVASGSSCSGTDDSQDALAGTTGTALQSAEATFTVTALAANAKVCINVGTDILIRGLV